MKCQVHTVRAGKMRPYLAYEYMVSVQHRCLPVTNKDLIASREMQTRRCNAVRRYPRVGVWPHVCTYMRETEKELLCASLLPQLPLSDHWVMGIRESQSLPKRAPISIGRGK